MECDLIAVLEVVSVILKFLKWLVENPEKRRRLLEVFRKIKNYFKR